jgi:hypothetical protein
MSGRGSQRSFVSHPSVLPLQRIAKDKRLQRTRWDGTTYENCFLSPPVRLAGARLWCHTQASVYIPAYYLSSTYQTFIHILSKRSRGKDRQGTGR